ncbi:MAG TPA: phytoene/squalene synthase family protein [Melioribacteraceae bacterium]|nr:phytoene/squalene synthase family protein [Melioribacteraceae bacterium]
MIQLYHNTSFAMSKVLTNAYSTSFSLGISAFAKEYRDPIYAIYGFVRLADEIVDSFHEHDKSGLSKKFRDDTFEAIEKGVSTNPVLHAFQIVVNKYNIDKELIDAFLISMEMDLDKSSYHREVYDKYIYGSAEVVGLMCLKVFVNGDQKRYDELLYPAKMLGSAFQKVNFLRDIKSDIHERGRIYLPDVHDTRGIDNENKIRLEKEVDEEFKISLHGISGLPMGVRLGVYTAYLYYFVLFKKIQQLGVEELLKRRVRVSNFTKFFLFLKSFWEIKVAKIRFD